MGKTLFWLMKSGESELIISPLQPNILTHLHLGHKLEAEYKPGGDSLMRLDPKGYPLIFHK